MTAPMPPGVPRPGYNAPRDPGFNRNVQGGVDGLSNNMQNLQINKQQQLQLPSGMNSVGPMRPPPPFSQPGSGQVGRPGAPLHRYFVCIS